MEQLSKHLLLWKEWGFHSFPNRRGNFAFLMALDWFSFLHLAEWRKSVHKSCEQTIRTTQKESKSKCNKSDWLQAGRTKLQGLSWISTRGRSGPVSKNRTILFPVNLRFNYNQTLFAGLWPQVCTLFFLCVKWGNEKIFKVIPSLPLTCGF